MKYFFYLLVFSLMFNTLQSQDRVEGINHYIFPEFTEGIVQMTDGTKNKVLLNYNSMTEEMLFKNNDNELILAIGKGEMQFVDSVFVKGRIFLPLNNKFVELLCHSNYDLYAEQKCNIIPPGKPGLYGTVSQTTSTATYSALYSEGMIYSLNLPEGYKTMPYFFYWIKKNGELKKFVNIKQLRDLYRNKRGLTKAYLKQNELKFENQESIVRFIKYMESN